MARFTAYVQESPRPRTVYVPFTVDDIALIGLTKPQRNSLLEQHAVKALRNAPNVRGDWWEWFKAGWTKDGS